MSGVAGSTFHARITPMGHAVLTGLSAAQPLPAVPLGATHAFVSVEGAAVRYRDDGLLPTAAVGFPLAAGDTLMYDGPMGAIRFVEIAPGASLSVAYYA